jgi:hypothetical protein
LHPLPVCSTVMSVAISEREQYDGLLVKPILTSRKMTIWKPGLKFKPETVNVSFPETETGTPGRFRKAGKHVQKGNFQKKNKVSDAPNLLSVVTATPEMKERAKADAKARQIKIEEFRKFKNSRTIVKKQPLKQPKSQWQNMITSTSHGKKSKAVAVSKKKSKSTGDIAIADWKDAYQDILSPNSGNRRFLARRDLATSVKVSSPKKKLRGKARSASATLFSQSLPFVHRTIEANPKDVFIDSFKSEEALLFSKSSTRKPPMVCDVSVDETCSKSMVLAVGCYDIESKGFSNGTASKPSVIVSPISEKEEVDIGSNSPYQRFEQSASVVVPFPCLGANDETVDRKEDGFIDFDEFNDSIEAMGVNEDDWTESEKVPRPSMNIVTEERTVSAVNDERMEFANSVSTEKQNSGTFQTEEHSGTFQTEEHSNPEKDLPRKPKKLILEFSMPNLTGEPQTGDKDDVGLEVPVDIYSYGDISSVGSWPSIESEDSYETRMNKLMQRWMDVDDGEENSFEFNKDVQLDDNVLDHIVLAAPDLEKAMEQFQKMTGIAPSHVGPLQGLGAKTAHIGLDNNRYIEILAPDNDDPGPLGDELKCLDDGTLTPYHYAIRSSEVSRLIEGYIYDVLGWDPDHIAMVQALPDDSVRKWDLLTMYGHDMGGVAPYYVRWHDSTRHPTAKIPSYATLLACRVVAPEDHDVHKLIAGVDGIDVETGEPTLECLIDTPNGQVKFSAKKPNGLVFPGYDHDCGDFPM